MNNEIKKTKRLGNEDSSNGVEYMITLHDGREFKVTRPKESQWLCGPYEFKTFKAAKDAIRNGHCSFVGTDSATSNEAELEATSQFGTWDCIHPCIWMISCIDLELINFDALGIDKSEFTKTLDNFGFLNESGKPDVERVERLLANAKKEIPAELKN